ncbi:DUF4124 domain-containing protein [Sedimenticola selenatireducens]|nr:DUF4124 domain-containing protein [Sedimenticola selenatireducens]
MGPIKRQAENGSHDEALSGMNRRAIFLLLLLMSVVWLDSAHAAVYRWVDADGRTQFGDRPPPDRSAEQVQIRQQPVPDEAGAPMSDQQRRELRQKMLDAYREEREEKRQAREQRVAEEARRKMACARAKDRVREYETAAGLYELQPDGSRRYLSDEEFRASLRRARDEVKRNCRQGD